MDRALQGNLVLHQRMRPTTPMPQLIGCAHAGTELDSVPLPKAALGT